MTRTSLGASASRTPPEGGIVTAPTNGAAGIVAAVLHHYDDWVARGS